MQREKQQKPLTTQKWRSNLSLPLPIIAPLPWPRLSITTKIRSANGMDTGENPQDAAAYAGRASADILPKGETCFDDLGKSIALKPSSPPLL